MGPRLESKSSSHHVGTRILRHPILVICYHVPIGREQLRRSVDDNTEWMALERGRAVLPRQLAAWGGDAG